MGVDILTCVNCWDTFPDCGYMVGCECGEHWCSDECAKADGYKHGEYEKDGEEYYEASCNFCRNEDFSDSELLSFVLSKLGLTRYDLVQHKSRSVKSDKDN